jgi:hypothetical protein
MTIYLIDISGAYDNVLIDILCDILRQKELPLQVMRFLFRFKTNSFHHNNVTEGIGFLCWRPGVYNVVVGYKGLPQGSVLTTQPFPIQYHWVVRG